MGSVPSGPALRQQESQFQNSLPFSQTLIVKNNYQKLFQQTITGQSRTKFLPKSYQVRSILLAIETKKERLWNVFVSNLFTYQTKNIDVGKTHFYSRGFFIQHQTMIESGTRKLWHSLHLTGNQRPGNPSSKRQEKQQEPFTIIWRKHFIFQNGYIFLFFQAFSHHPLDENQEMRGRYAVFQSFIFML